MNYLAAGLVTIAIVTATHMGARVFHAPEGAVVWRIVRYGMGCVAILTGLLFVLEWPTWLLVGGVVLVAGVTTVVNYAAVELFNYRNRALMAEEDGDIRHEP